MTIDDTPRPTAWTWDGPRIEALRALVTANAGRPDDVIVELTLPDLDPDRQATIEREMARPLTAEETATTELTGDHDPITLTASVVTVRTMTQVPLYLRRSMQLGYARRRLAELDAASQASG